MAAVMAAAVLTAPNTYTAQTNVLSGTLNIQNSLALGGLQAGTVSPTTAPVSSGTVVASGATLQLQGPSNATGLTINELIGTVTLTNAALNAEAQQDLAAQAKVSRMFSFDAGSATLVGR